MSTDLNDILEETLTSLSDDDIELIEGQAEAFKGIVDYVKYREAIERHKQSKKEKR